jgi:hypothetical protein
MVVGRERLALDRLSPSVARPEHQCQSVPRVQKETRTMTNPKLDDLIARIAAATGPDRALDAEIAVALRIVSDKAPKWLRRWTGPFALISFEGSDPGQLGAMRPNGENAVNWPAPRFTASLDAAITLIPDDLWWCIAKGKTRPDEPLYGAQILGGEKLVAESECDGSAALCLCIAALKARTP